jgi:hypothetical protein
MDSFLQTDSELDALTQLFAPSEWPGNSGHELDLEPLWTAAPNTSFVSWPTGFDYGGTIDLTPSIGGPEANPVNSEDDSFTDVSEPRMKRRYLSRLRFITDFLQITPYLRARGRQ